MTAEKVLEDMKPEAVTENSEQDLFLKLLLRLKILKYQKMKLNVELQKMADMYKMELDKVKELMGENEEKQIKEDLAVQKAVDLIVDTAVEK